MALQRVPVAAVGTVVRNPLCPVCLQVAMRLHRFRLADRFVDPPDTSPILTQRSGVRESSVEKTFCRSAGGSGTRDAARLETDMNRMKKSDSHGKIIVGNDKPAPAGVLRG